MDIELQKRINDVITHLQSMMSESVDYQLMDPIAKMMLVALLYETQKIRDVIDGFDQKLIDRFCENFIPMQDVEAMPALAVVSPLFKKNKDSDCIQIGSGVSFTYKEKSSKTAISYLPLFKNMLVPYEDIYVLTRNRLTSKEYVYEIQMEKSNILWIGIHTKAEVESLEGFSFFLNKKDNVYPQAISVMGSSAESIGFSMMNRMEDIEMLEPFDAQQVSTRFLSVIEYWKERLQELPGGVLVTITDKTRNRDLFKKRAYPRVFQNWLESDVLNCFNDETLWFQVEFPENYIVSDDCEVIFNAIPVVNVDLNSVTLTQAAPVAKLQKQDGSFFVSVLETSNAAHKQGFSMSAEEFVIRDFDAHCYHHGDLYRDIRNLYNHFVEDYYAFIEYNGLKDGQDIKRLKELVNKIAKSVGEKNDKFKFDSGTYVMKNIKQATNNSVTKVSFLTTLGALGNMLDVTVNSGSSKLECKKLPVIESNVPVVVSASGGKDKATADQRYELIRYYSLTNDRLYTKMDVEAFVRKELIAIYGKEEFKRIFINVHIEGTAGRDSVQHGLYVDIEFKDKKNYEKANAIGMEDVLNRKIINHSCISMPIKVELSCV
ncbi:hypothetical protein ACRASS_12035 [Bacteroides hominis]|uniref:hypothetical protein n=1 Tax=Bacteroidales TaxID=171549 RepID=UPI000B386AAB|nr:MULTISPECIES: hypothetical protein [Bacteroidales]UBD75114.1 hypothetical protein K6V26_01735 [Parabacteroides goldsteinii]